MTDYNFLNLSPPEFENLAKDLLQRKENLILESFKEGKDNGIDFREPHKQIIVQVKRFKDDFRYFYNALKREVPSVKRNKPKRYILITSVRLTPKNKAEIFSLFNPFIKDTADIIGGNDLNNLLSLYNDIEERHSKLWLTSTRVLKKFLNEIRNSVEKIIYRKELNCTAFELELVQKYARLYVQTESFDKALKILKKQRYIIISGEPGIGKTTLGRALIAYLLEKKKCEEFINILGDIESAWGHNSDLTQVFFYDDFLGDIDLYSGRANNKLLKFIGYIKKSSDKYLIITTREYVLKKGEESYPELRKLEVSKCLLEKEEYSEYIRAKILYNHIYFGDMHYRCVDCLVKNDNYKRIINHRNYNPRYIEMFLENQDFFKDSSSFTDRLVSWLNNPYRYWERIFSMQPKAAQQVLLILLISNAPMAFTHLLSTFCSLNRLFPLCDHGYEEVELKSLIRKMHDTFIRKDKDVKNAFDVIEFTNTTVKDFLLTYLGKNKSLAENLIKSAMYFNQLFFVFTTKNEMIKVFDYESDYSLFGYKINLDKKLGKILKDKLISDFDDLYSSKLDTIQCEDGNSYQLKYPRIDRLERLEFVCRQFYLDRPENSELKNFVLEKFIAAISCNEGEVWELSSEDLGVIPTLVKILKPYLQLEASKLIRTYFNSIKFSVNYLTFYKFKDIYPKEFRVFYNSLDKKRLKAQIKETILENIEYYCWSLIPGDFVEKDMLLDCYIDEIFEEYKIRKSKRFMKAAFEKADRDIHSLEDQVIIEWDDETQTHSTSETGDPDDLFLSLKPNLKRGSYFQVKPDEIHGDETWLNEKLITTYIQSELGNGKPVKKMVEKILSKDVYIDFLENPVALSVLSNYLIQNLSHSEEDTDLYLEILFWMLKDKKNKASITLGLDSIKNILAEMAFNLAEKDMWWFNEAQAVSVLDELKGKNGYVYDSKELLSQMEFEFSIFIRDGIWYTFLFMKIHYFFSAQYISALPNHLKKTVYAGEFRRISEYVQVNGFTPNEFWEFVKKSDEQKFYSCFAIPLLKELKGKIDSNSDWGICNSYFSVFEIVMNNREKSENDYAEYDRNTPSLGCTISIHSMLTDFIEIDFNSYIVDDFFFEMMEQEELGERNLSKCIPITGLLNQLDEYLVNKIKRAKAQGKHVPYWWGVPITECMNDDLFYNLIKKLGIVQRIVKNYKLFLKEISNLENQYNTGD